jgi:hypothetical protein
VPIWDEAHLVFSNSKGFKSSFLVILLAKVLYRTAMALLKAFSRELARPGCELYISLKSPGGQLQPEFIKFCGELPVSAQAEVHITENIIRPPSPGETGVLVDVFYVTENMSDSGTEKRGKCEN